MDQRNTRCPSLSISLSVCPSVRLAVSLLFTEGTMWDESSDFSFLVGLGKLILLIYGASVYLTVCLSIKGRTLKVKSGLK